MGLFSRHAERQSAREEAGRQSYLAALGIESVEAAKAQTQAAEESRLAVMGMLGQEPAPGTGAADFSKIYDTESERAQGGKAAFGLMQYGHLVPGAVNRITGTRQGILDPEKYAEEVSKTAQFQIQSKLTSEAKQLLEREGPAWNRLEQATHGQIFEGAATALRESVRQIKNDAAKGGTARRNALVEANRILAVERANSMKVRETWDANLRLDQFVRENAAKVQEQNINFLDNLPGIRQEYNNTMNSLAEVMSSVAVPAASKASQAAYAIRDAVKDDRWAEKLIMGVASTVLSSVGGGALGGVLGGAGSAVSAGASSAGASIGGGQTGGLVRNIIGGAVSKGGGWVGGLLNTAGQDISAKGGDQGFFGIQ